ncbi:MAG: RNA methyltransferase [Nitrosomonadales bacterium]|nr:RNA methyltransferase [Nitrosomonadales bacterium]
MKHITSRDNPLFKELLKLVGSPRQRHKSGQTLLDGAHLLESYRAAGGQPQALLVTSAGLLDAEVARLLEQFPAVPQILLDDALFAQLSELKTPSGILAQITVPAPAIMPAESRFALLLEDIQDPGNLGSMLRSAAAAGCDAVFLSRGCADAWSPKVLRAAMGGHFAHAMSLHEQVDLLAVAAMFEGQTYAASLAGRTSLYDCELRGKTAFAIGNEGAGLSGGLLTACQPFIIPMPGQVESLNAAAAAAICLFEAVRQRR